MTIGEKMKFRRKELKISADEIAKTLGVSRSTIFRYEKGEIEKLPTENLRKIAEVLKTTPEELMGWTKTENKKYMTLLIKNYKSKNKNKLKMIKNQLFLLKIIKKIAMKYILLLLILMILIKRILIKKYLKLKRF